MIRTEGTNWLLHRLNARLIHDTTLYILTTAKSNLTRCSRESVTIEIPSHSTSQRTCCSLSPATREIPFPPTSPVSAEEGHLRWTGLGIWAGRHGDGECVALCRLEAVLRNDELLLASSFLVGGLMASGLLNGRWVAVSCLL